MVGNFGYQVPNENRWPCPADGGWCGTIGIQWVQITIVVWLKQEILLIFHYNPSEQILTMETFPLPSTTISIILPPIWLPSSSTRGVPPIGTLTYELQQINHRVSIVPRRIPTFLLPSTGIIFGPHATSLALLVVASMRLISFL